MLILKPPRQLSSRIEKDSEQDLTNIDKLIGVITRRGNKLRATTFTFALMRLIQKKKISRHPIALINKILSAGQPPFLLKRVFKSGRLFQLPIPISDNHSCFLAIHWLLEEYNKDKVGGKFPYKLGYQLMLLYNKKGSYNTLKSYIDTALDQRPFSHYIRRKRKTSFKPKRTRLQYLERRRRKRKKTKTRLIAYKQKQQIDRQRSNIARFKYRKTILKEKLRHSKTIRRAQILKRRAKRRNEYIKRILKK